MKSTEIESLTPGQIAQYIAEKNISSIGNFLHRFGLYVTVTVKIMHIGDWYVDVCEIDENGWPISGVRRIPFDELSELVN